MKTVTHVRRQWRVRQANLRERRAAELSALRHKVALAEAEVAVLRERYIALHGVEAYEELMNRVSVRELAEAGVPTKGG